MGRTFDSKISDLDQRERQLNQKIEDALTRIDQQRKEAEQLVSEARARLRQDIRDIQGAELPKIHGKLEETDHQLKRNREQTDNVQHRVESLTQLLLKQQSENEKRLGKLEETQRSQLAALNADQQTLSQDLGKLVARVEALSPALTSLAQKVDARLAEQDKAIAENHAQAAGLSQQVGVQKRALADQVANLGDRFAEYKKALEAFGEKVVKQDARISEVSQNSVRQTEALRTKVESDLRDLTAHLGTITTTVDAERQGTVSHLAEVNKSVASVADALKSMSTEMLARIDSQDARIRETTAQVAQVTDSLTKLAESLEQRRGTAMERTDAHERRLEAQAQQLSEVNESVASLAEAMRTLSQGVMERVQAQDERLTEADRSLQAVKTRLEAISGTVSEPRKTPGQPSKSGSTAPSREVTVESTTTSSRRAADRAVVERQARERYERLLGVFMEGDLDGAREGFLEFLTQFPDSTRAPNAQYWLGECYYGKKQYQEAISAFERVVVKYPDSNKAPAALLKKGYAQLALDNRQQAKATLQEVVKIYPRSPEAQKASDRLSHLK